MKFSILFLLLSLSIPLATKAASSTASFDSNNIPSSASLPYGDTSAGQRLIDPIPAPIQKGSVRLRLKQIASGLTAPNWAVPAPGEPDYLYVSDQDGKLWRINLITQNKEVFLDFSNLLVPLGAFDSDSFDERGFLGLAFHSDYAENSLLYTYTSEFPTRESSDFSTIPAGISPNHRSVIREWRLNPASLSQALPIVEETRILLTVDQPQFNHNGGALNFGPDGMLYIALGDGGGADDRDGQNFIGSPIIGHGAEGNGQNTANPLGSLLRIDPAGNNSNNGQYGIPPDNPFVGSGTVLAETYAYGFRNPFRFSFDPPTGLLVLADVGQNDIEEVNLVQAGGNYGWGLKEGNFRFEPNGNGPGFVTNGVVSGNFSDPVIQYDHDEGTAIIGGFIYRGKAIAALAGHYVFGDVAKTGQGDGRLFYSNGSQIRELDLTTQDQPGFWVLGIGQDAAGELYVLGNTTGTPFGTTGAVYKLVSNATFFFGVTEIPALGIRIEGFILEIPSVDVTFSDGTHQTYRALLQLVEGSQLLRFKLSHAEELADHFRGDGATFNQTTGELSLPFINVLAANGQVATYAAELQQVPDQAVLTFELQKEPERVK